ncbi:hypothetical protein [Roseibium sp.]|uniref:hypothetical protein n=1 Tax=Roseibium sp. TaxID=1936156 RepID=UPI003BAE1718
MPPQTEDQPEPEKAMADGVKPKKSSVSQTEWTLYSLAVATATLVTLAAIVAHLT